MKATRLIAPLFFAAALILALLQLLTNPAPAAAQGSGNIITNGEFANSINGWSEVGVTWQAAGTSWPAPGSNPGSALFAGSGSRMWQQISYSGGDWFNVTWHWYGNATHVVRVKTTSGQIVRAYTVDPVICNSGSPRPGDWNECGILDGGWNVPAGTYLVEWEATGGTGALDMARVYGSLPQTTPTSSPPGGSTPPPGSTPDPGDPTPTPTPLPTATATPTPGPTTGNYFDVPIRFIPGSGTNYGDASDISCTVTASQVSCTGTANHWYYWRAYGRDNVRSTGFITSTGHSYYGWYADFTQSGPGIYEGLGMVVDVGYVTADNSGRVCALLSDRPEIPGGPDPYEWIFDGVGCTHFAGAGSTVGGVGLTNIYMIAEGYYGGSVPGSEYDTRSFTISNPTLRSGSPPPTPPTDEFGAICATDWVLTTTLNITNTGIITDPVTGITSTIIITDSSPVTTTVPITWSASLLQDGSFEAGHLWNSPHWQYAGAGYWDRIGPANQLGDQYAWRYATNGLYSLWKTEYQDTGGNTQMCQRIEIPDGADFLRVGASIIAGEGGSGSRGADLRYYQTIASGSVTANPADPFAVAWQNITGNSGPVNATGGGPFCVQVGPGTSSIYVDAVFAYAMQGDPEDENNLSLVCPPVPEDAIPGPPGGIDPPPTPTPSPSPTPDPGDAPPPPPPPPIIDLTEAVCTECIFPGLTLEPTRWIGWLGCKISNLFFCHLVVWIANVTNYTHGIFAWGRGLTWWLGWLANNTLGWGWSVIQALWGVFRLTLQIFWPNVNALFGNMGGYLGVMVAAVEMMGGWSRDTLLAFVGYIGSSVMAGWIAALNFILTRMIPWPLRFLWHWVQQAWPLIWEFLVWVGENAGGWLQWLIDNISAARDAALAWMWNLMVNLARAIMESRIVQNIWHAIEFFIWLLGALWQMVTLWAGRLLALGQAVVDFVMMLWQMALQTVAALRADPFTTVDVFGHETSELSYTGRNETSILYLILVGIFIADSLLNITVAMVLINVVMALMAWGLIKWTLVEFTDLLPVR
jgi:hypothetical protein